MNTLKVSQDLWVVLKQSLDDSTTSWIKEKQQEVLSTKSAKKLYLMYSLLGGKMDKSHRVNLNDIDGDLRAYLELQKADLLQISRVYLLSLVLKEDGEFFRDKVANIIQVADTGELETFLKYLVLLPNAEDYKYAAVEALRTNISTIFDAITLNNPYPSKYFNEQQWNQMYLKAAFMQRDLTEILDVDIRANKDLTRIISDYAHERWAASREIDPIFWRPVSNYIEGDLINDIERLFKSENLNENRAAALCCYNSNKAEAKLLLEKYSDLLKEVSNSGFTWKDLK
jgi:hypothetical protein